MMMNKPLQGNYYIPKNYKPVSKNLIGDTNIEKDPNKLNLTGSFWVEKVPHQAKLEVKKFTPFPFPSRDIPYIGVKCITIGHENTSSKNYWGEQLPGGKMTPTWKIDTTFPNTALNPYLSTNKSFNIISIYKDTYAMGLVIIEDCVIDLTSPIIKATTYPYSLHIEGRANKCTIVPVNKEAKEWLSSLDISYLEEPFIHLKPHE